MNNKPQTMRRRNFLRTTTGILALPWLESFSNGRLLAASEKTASAPTRFLTLFFPNGVYPSAWQASMNSGDLELEGTLGPLAPFSGKANVITGLNNPLGGHLGQTAGFLSGIDFEQDERGVVTSGTSLDQMLAQHWARDSFLPSLNLAVEPPSQGGFGNKPRSYGNSISWSSPTSKIEPVLNPQQAFDRVFFGQTEAGRQVAGRRKRIVDEIWGQAKSLESQVSSYDRQKMAQYMDSITDLEAKLEKAIHPVEKAWKPKTAVETKRPEQSGIPSDHRVHLRLLLDIMLLSFQTDSTRVGTMVMGHSISRVVYKFIDKKITRNHHDYSHHRNDPEKITGYNQITQWLAGEAAYVLERMEAIDEGNGTMLDNSAVLFGSCMKDGNVHEPVDVPVALFGKAGGKLKTNRLIECEEGSLLSQLHLSLMHLMGLEADSFNGVTRQTVPGLL